MRQESEGELGGPGRKGGDGGRGAAGGAKDKNMEVSWLCVKVQYVLLG